MKASKPFTLAHCRIEPSDLTLRFDGDNKQPLQPKFIEVLCYLAEHCPRVITREELIENVWDDNNYVGEKALNNAVWQLRKSLKGVNGDDDVIKTIRKVGYQLLVEPIWQDTSVETNAQGETHTKPSPTLRTPHRHHRRLQQYLPYALISLLAMLLMWSLFTRESVTQQPKITQITKAPGSELFVAPSPDGRYVVYKWLSPDNKVDLYMQDRLHTEIKPQQLTFDTHDEGHSVWSNDGQFLYFSRKNKAKQQCEIIRLKVDSHQETPMTNCPMHGGYYYLDISPDDKTLAFHGYSEPADDAGIYFLDLTGADTRPYRFSCAHNCGYKDRDFAFSPDGKSIAVSRRTNRFAENIYLVDLASKTAKPLTRGEEDIVGLSWHPDGKQIVYATQNADVRKGYILDVANKTRVELDIDGFSYPAFAKTSKALFFQQRQESYHIVSLPLGQTIASSPFLVVQSDFNHHSPDYSAKAKKFARLTYRVLRIMVSQQRWQRTQTTDPPKNHYSLSQLVARRQ
jgi:Tol biopolymer transport system component/DNA-binding winged helix-turn-helix (wHTH) protein